MTAQTITASPTDAPRFAAWVAGAAATLRARRWWIVAVAVVSLIAAVAYLRTADYTYSASFRVVPAPGSNRESNSLGALSTLATLTGATLESIPVTPFRLYTEGIYTRQVAAGLAGDPAVMRHVFADEWDAAAGKWREPSGPGRSLGRLADRIGGVADRGWSPPDAARLQQWITTNVRIDQTAKTPVATLALDDRDPRFAAAFLTRLHRDADDWVRARSLERSRANIAYLVQRLPGVTQADHRDAIFATLNDQQQRLMAASNPAPFAAEPFGSAVVSPQPTAPRQIPLLLLALVLGTAVGVALALLIPRRA
jgi:uncharacterized protein involved in exopolysaccharide biosynthesis